VTTVLTTTLARLLLAPILVLAVAVLVKGYVDTGDGFSAGAIAAIGILLQYLALGRAEVMRRLPVRRLPALTFAGLLAALALALAPLLQDEPVLKHVPPARAHVTKVGTLELTTAVALDVAIFILVLGAAVGILDAVARRAEDPGR
jgi:multisubunit Na+/H+ antiporter MnhB subunit